MPLQVVSAEFAKTATRPEEWPRGPAPEIAFVGRSNVGKSSMLNALTRRKGLARAKLFNWEKTARATLDVYERIARPH